MSWGYTLDDIRQTQAYLLSEAEELVTLFRSNSNTSPNHAHSKVYAPSMMASTSDSPIITPNPSDFIEYPDECLIALQPEIKVYKTFTDGMGNELNYLLPMGNYLESTGKVEQGVVVKGAEFTRLGGNPAELDTNIKFNLKLFARDITTFFVKNEVAPLENFANSIYSQDSLAMFAGFALEEEALNQATADAAAEADEWDAAQDSAEGVSSPPISGGPVYQSQVDDYNELQSLGAQAEAFGPNGERKVAWIDLIKIDPGQELNAASAELLVDENHARIKIEIGYAPVPTKPAKFKGTPEAWAKWAKAIEEQREVFYLTLTKHSFDFRGYDGVGLSIDFIATANAKRLSLEADIFHDADMEIIIKAQSSEIESKEEELRLAATAENPSDRVSECIEQLETGIEELETKILKYRTQNKLKLLRQLYLSNSTDGTDNATYAGTKVFGRRWKPTREKKSDEEHSDVSRRQLINHGADDGTGYYYMDDLMVPSTNETGDIRYAMRNIQAIDLDAAEEGAESGITREHREDGTREDTFVFLGDIIESAFEILTPSDTKMGLSWRTTVVEGNWFGRNSIVISALTASKRREMAAVLDKAASGMSYTAPFTWREITTDATGATEQAERFKKSIQKFGGILTGEVSYTNPNSTTLSPTPITIKIRDIPIALDIFRSWWINTYVKSGKKSLPLNDFIVALMRFVEREVFAKSPLDFGRTEDRVDDPKFIVNNINVDAASVPKLFSTVNSFANISLTDINQVEDFGQNPVLVIEQVDSNPWLTSAVSQIVFGETTKGILKKIDFEREDIPGHAEARLFSDRSSTSSNLALREKYNTSIETLGLTCYKPGSLLYLDPLPLDLGYTSQAGSLSRSLGLGGMYRVVNLTSTLSFDSSGGTWNTKVRTKWESFGNGSNGVQAVTNPSPASLGKCIDDEIAWLEAKIDGIQDHIDIYVANTSATHGYARDVDEIVRLNGLINELRSNARED
jgi:hypothetical protein